VEPIINDEMRLVDVAQVCPHSGRSLKQWKKAYQERGMAALVAKSTRPKTQPRETPIRVKEEVISLRKETGLCAQKLHWRLEKQGLSVPVSTIGKILKDAGLVRKYRKKKIKYQYLRAERQPGELLEIDVKYVPGSVANKQYFQYTAIDTASRWRYLAIYEEQSSFHSVKFLKVVIERFPHNIEAIKTDNHSTFTNYYLGTNKRSDMSVKRLHFLDRFCADNNIVHYLIDPEKLALIRPEQLKTGAAFIDFGYGSVKTASGSTLSGDLNTQNELELEKLSFYTPTPGGTGPILVAEIFKNFYVLTSNLVDTF